MDLTQCFDHQTAVRECKRLLPECKFYSANLLVEALAHVFSMMEVDLHLKVWDMLSESHTSVAVVCDEWLLRARVSQKQYLSRVVNRGIAIDRLFV